METGSLHNCIIVIPALDPGPELPDYVESLLGLGARGVVVVDDGSDGAHQAAFPPLLRPGLHLRRSGPPPCHG